MHESLFYPCIIDSSGHVRQQVSKQPMSQAQAELILKTHYRQKWLKCEAIPQPVNHPYFTGSA
jgi:hypothetical protein